MISQNATILLLLILYAILFCISFNYFGIVYSNLSATNAAKKLKMGKNFIRIHVNEFSSI